MLYHTPSSRRDNLSQAGVKKTNAALLCNSKLCNFELKVIGMCMNEDGTLSKFDTTHKLNAAHQDPRSLSIFFQKKRVFTVYAPDGHFGHVILNTFRRMSHLTDTSHDFG